jgi:hypothetical protein
MNRTLVGSILGMFSIKIAGHPIDASYQVSVRLAKRFQRRRFLKISNIGIEITAFPSMEGPL